MLPNLRIVGGNNVGYVTHKISHVTHKGFYNHTIAISQAGRHGFDPVARSKILF